MTTSQEPHRIERSSKEVQVVFGGTYIASTSQPLLVWEQPAKPPQYFLPEASLLRDHVQVKPLPNDSASVGNFDHDAVESFELTAGGKRTVYKAFRAGALEGHIRLEFAEMDAWLESGALTRLPPKNPSRRIDTALTSTHVIVNIGGAVVADARDAVVLYETGIPPRYYLPATSVVDWKLLKSSDKLTACPYKGEARYFSVEVEGKTWEDVAWYYLYPVAESAAIAGRLAFTVGREGVRIAVDGVEIEK
ncbi:MAG: hypothetical protein M1833_006586 [Piccolia ochrophora]|nr:MAG: hypothetical protein M1833_006586 [Piccolia ochrophora]